MNLPLCFSSLGCPDFTFEEFCRLARTEGFSLVEIRALEGTADFVLRMTDHPEKLAQSKALLNQYELEARVLGSSFCLTTAGPDGIDSLVREGRVADALGTPFLRIFGGGGEKEKITPELIQKITILYQLAVARLKAEGIRAELLVETHGGFTNSETILKFCHALENPVPLLWDTHHTWKIGGESLSDTYPRLRPFIRHFHVKDSVSTPNGNRSHRYVVPGTGEFPFAELLQLLEVDPPDAAFSLEWEKKWHPEIPPLEEALQGWKKLLAG